MAELASALQMLITTFTASFDDIRYLETLADELVALPLDVFAESICDIRSELKKRYRFAFGYKSRIARLNMPASDCHSMRLMRRICIERTSAEIEVARGWCGNNKRREHAHAMPIRIKYDRIRFYDRMWYICKLAGVPLSNEIMPHIIVNGQLFEPDYDETLESVRNLF